LLNNLLHGNRSNFLGTDGALAWLYTCNKQISPYKETKNCYDHIPIWFNGRTEFIDTVTRKIVDPLLVIDVDCDKAKDFAYHLNLDDTDSWYRLLPFPAIIESPNQFKSTMLERTTGFHTFSMKRTGLYTTKDIARFMARISTGQQQKGLLKKMIRNIGRSIK